MEKADSPVEIGKYICGHADAIFRHANAIRPIGEDESFYIVTSCVKSGSWAMAAFKDKMAAEHNTLQLVSIAPSRQEAGLPKYSWTKRGSAQTRWGRSTDGHTKDQTLFLRGFKLALSAEFRLRLECDDGQGDDDDDGDDGEDEQDDNENDGSNSKHPRDAQPDRNTDHASEYPDFDGNDKEPSGEDRRGNSWGSKQNNRTRHRAYMLAEAGLLDSIFQANCITHSALGIDCTAFPGTTFAVRHLTHPREAGKALTEVISHTTPAT
jgi:hypothetical protein